jgi:hypothetical protein
MGAGVIRLPRGRAGQGGKGDVRGAREEAGGVVVSRTYSFSWQALDLFGNMRIIFLVSKTGAER